MYEYFREFIQRHIHPVTAGYVFFCHLSFYIHNIWLHSQALLTCVSCNQYVAETDCQLIFDKLLILSLK